MFKLEGNKMKTFMLITAAVLALALTAAAQCNNTQVQSCIHDYNELNTVNVTGAAIINLLCLPVLCIR